MNIPLTTMLLGLVSAITLTCVAAPGSGRGMVVGDGTNVLARLPQLATFIQDKEKQARKDTQAAGEEVPDEVWAFFKAAREGDWQKAVEIWQSSISHASGSKVCQTAAGAPALEVVLLMEQFAAPNTKYAEAYGRGIIDSIPRGSIYFGGTDPGRGLVTVLCKSQINADPFFTLTQNALADGTYLAYLRRMYGAKISIPSTNDSANAFAEYVADAQRRLEHDRKFRNEPRQINPGEDVRMVDGKVQVSGQVAVMAINGLLTKMIFDKNPDREFYIEESFPLDWMYPHLSPHGLVMKINRASDAELSEAVIAKDHDFWAGQLKKMLGDWLSYDTSVKEVCAFVEKVYLDKNLQGFGGDQVFLQDEQAQKAFSKLRSSIGGLYFWNFNNTKSQAERTRFNKEADFAFRQAFALCPVSPEALFRHINLLIGQNRVDDALIFAETTGKLDPANSQVQGLLQELKRIKKAQKK